MTEIQYFISFTSVILFIGFPLAFFGLRFFIKETVTFKTLVVLTAMGGLFSILIYGGSFLSIWHILWEIIIGVAIIYIGSKALKIIYSKMLTEVELAMAKFSDGNFSFLKSDDYKHRKDQIGKIIFSSAKLGKKVDQMFERVTKEVDKIDNVQEQMNKTSTELNTFASKQAESVILISDSAERLVNAITQHTLQSSQAYNKAKKAVVKTQINDKNVRKSIQSLTDISSRVSVISDIAFQTHLLSLNAAIEAAKVKQGGEGFKAVAQQIRKLSEKSSVSSKEISVMIKKSNAVAERTQRISKQILPEVSAASNIIKEISSQGESQVSGAEVINQAIKSIIKTSQLVAENAQKIDEFSDILNGLTKNIKNNTNFIISEDKEHSTHNNSEEIRNKKRGLL